MRGAEGVVRTLFCAIERLEHLDGEVHLDALIRLDAF